MDSSDGETDSEMEYEAISPEPGPSTERKRPRPVISLKAQESAKRLAEMLNRIQIEPGKSLGKEVDVKALKKEFGIYSDGDTISYVSSESSEDKGSNVEDEIDAAIFDAVERYIKFNENRPKLPLVDELNGILVRELPEVTDQMIFDEIRGRKNEPLKKRPRISPRTRSQSNKQPGKGKKQVVFKVPELPERLKRKKANPNNNRQKNETIIQKELTIEPMELETVKKKGTIEKKEIDKLMPAKEKFMDYLIPRMLENDGEDIDEATDGETSEKGEEGDDENEEDEETNNKSDKMEEEPSRFWCHIKALNDDFKNKELSADDYHEELLKAFCHRIDLKRKLDPIKARRQTKIITKGEEEHPSILAKHYLESFHQTYSNDQEMKHETPKMKLLPEIDRLNPKTRGKKDDFVIVKGDIVRTCSHRTGLPSFAQVRGIFADETTKDYAQLTWLRPISKHVNIHEFDPKKFKHFFEDEQYYPLENLTVECHRPKLFEYQENPSIVGTIVHKKHRRYLKKKMKYLSEQKRRDEETPRPDEEVLRRPRSPLPAWISRRETYKKKKSGMIVLNYILEAGQQPIENE